MTLHRRTIRELRIPPKQEVDRLVRQQHGAADWCIRATWCDRLFDETAPDWFDLTPGPATTLVKKGRGRSAWRIHLGSSSVFAKLLNASGLWDGLRQFLRGTPAEQEWLACRQAERLGIPVPRSLAVGVRKRPIRCNVFLSENLMGAVPVAEFWRTQIAGAQGAERRRRAVSTVESLAKLLALAHEQGFVHRDGHPNNILLQLLPNGAQRASFVDLYGGRFYAKSVPMRRAVRSLAQLDQFVQRLATRTERLRFLRGYFRNRHAFRQHSSDPVRERQWIRHILHARRRLASRLARQWDRRLRRNGKYFARLQLDGGWSATVVLALERRHVFPERGVRDRNLEEWRSALNTLLRSVGMKERDPDGIEPSGLSVDPVRLSGWVERVGARFVGPRHQSLFERCHRLRHRDQQAPLILAWAEHKTGWLPDQTALIRGTNA